MQAWFSGGRTLLIGAALASLLTLPAFAKPTNPAHAKPTAAAPAKAQTAAVAKGRGGVTKVSTAGGSKQVLSASKFTKTGKVRYAVAYGGGGGISCVPFARAASGIDLKGNATAWWDAADGVYARGARPEAGSVLNFRATGRMRLGHVAVVAAVVDSRQVIIDHANWAGPGASKGGISRGIPVMDVSENNDWTAVRVGLGRSGDYGSVYPTYGFIYDRPDRGTMLANTMASPGATSATRYAAGTNLISAASYDEVAEAPAPRRALRKPATTRRNH